MNHKEKVPRGFYVLSLITLVVGVLLIWVGAAVTTTGSGMAFSDWPLSNGSVNPSGWLFFTPQLLEHGHRLMATLVGLLVLAMFIWQWRVNRQPWAEMPILVGAFAMLVSAGSKSQWWVVGVLGAACVAWLVFGLVLRRWSFMLKLTATALIVVVAQALLGGIRVLQVSDPYGVAHGCLGQLFYCLLISISLVAAPSWKAGEVIMPQAAQRRAVWLTTILFAATSLQLLFGAIVRHTQRQTLAASDIITTGGKLVPPTDPVDVFSIFLHKSWGMVVFTLALLAGFATLRHLSRAGWLCWLPRFLIVLPILQVTLGVFVLHTMKKFWVTNFHVLNGLAILATAFLLMVTMWRARGHRGMVADSNPMRKDALA